MKAPPTSTSRVGGGRKLLSQEGEPQRMMWPESGSQVQAKTGAHSPRGLPALQILPAAPR